MKNLVLVILIFLTLFSEHVYFAQVPQGMSYQAILRDIDNSVITYSEVNMIFKIHNGSANGSIVYQESQTLISNSQGLVTCNIGTGLSTQGNFADINWANEPKFLQVVMGDVDLGTVQMMSVPYALYAGACDIRVSVSGDTLHTGGGGFVIVPGISEANYPFTVNGCMDSNACNYNSFANYSDGGCIYSNDLCDDGNSNTMNDLFDGNCICSGQEISFGCTDSNSCNFNSLANLDNGSCLVTGHICDDANAATVNDIIGSDCMCQGELVVLGCMDSNACNFNIYANQDDQSCVYVGTLCDDSLEYTLNDSIDSNCECHGFQNSVNVIIGQYFQGGKVAYIFQPGNLGYVSGEVHGLIATPSDLDVGYAWGCIDTNIPGASGQGLGTGNQNTLDIVAAGCSGAAEACHNLVLNGYDDWYLPSRAEIQIMFNNRSLIGGFQSPVYWTSTQEDFNGAWAWNIFFGWGDCCNTGGYWKASGCAVRPVRSF